MSSPTKARTSIWAANTLVAGAADETSSTIDLTTKYASSLNIWILNGATGPTLAAEVQIQVSANGTKWANFSGPLVVGTANSAEYSWGGIDIPIGNMYLRLVAGSNTDEDVTIDADIGQVTATA